MDSYARDYYELKFKVEFMERRGDAFQDLFATLMEMRHPGDFQRTRPWGNKGDRKNDGYLKSKRVLFQVYGPNDLSASETMSKIDEDFEGALKHWDQYLDAWVFIHNSRIGLSADILERLLHCEAVLVGKGKPSGSVQHWGFAELRGLLFDLADVDIASMLGPAPTLHGMVRLGMTSIAPLLAQISRVQPTEEPDLRPFSAEKLKANMLSPHVRTLLLAGMTREQLVRDYFRAQSDPRFRDETAEAFRAKYSALRAQGGLNPDEIFHGLHVFVGGSAIGQPYHQEAVLAVLAYMFQECEIFERPGPSA